MRRKRILFVIESLDTNGAVTSLLALLKTLPRDRYDISLFLFSHDGELTCRVPKDTNLLPESSIYATLRLPLKDAVGNALRKCRLDLVLFRLLVSFQRALGLEFFLWWCLPKIRGTWDVVCGYSDGFVAPMIERKIKRGKKCCWVHCPYNHWPQAESVYDALCKADKIVPVSKDTGVVTDMILKGKGAPQHIVHNIIDSKNCLERAKETCEISRRDGVCRIVSVGRVTPPKGFDIIASVAVKLRQIGIRFEWIVVGNGNKFNDLKNCDPDVQFIGNKANPMPIVKSADVIVQPSRFEAWGMTVSEALCIGKAVVTSDLPVFAEQITDGINGLMRSFDANALAEAIARILTDAELKSRLERNAVHYPFTKEKVIEEFDALVSSLGVS